MTYQPFAENIYYDGKNLSDYFDINNIDPDPLASFESVTTKIPGKAGSVFRGKNVGERVIRMDMSIKGCGRDTLSISKAWRRVAHYLVKDEPKPLKLDDGRTIYALPMSASQLQRLGRRGVSTVDFTAFDPYFYGKTYTINLVSGQNLFYVQSDHDVLPTIELTGASGAVTITNYLTGEQVRIPSVQNSAATVVIDMAALKCTINGNHLDVDMNFTDFFGLSPGKNDIRLSAGKGILRYTEVLE